MFTYILDSADRFLAIEGPWDGFALANGAPGLTREAVLGQSMSAFVSGMEMQELTRMLLARARRGPVMALEFRCDSPSERRYLEMELSSLPGDQVRCETRLLRSEPRPSRRVLAAETPRSRDLLVACSWCRRVRLPGYVWAEIDEAVDMLSLFMEIELPQISHGICEACRDLMRGTRATA